MTALATSLLIKAKRRSARLPKPIVAFLLVMLLPHTLAFSAGPVLITTYRALMIALTPLIVRQILRQRQEMTLPDIVIAAFTLWSVLCIGINFPGSQSVERGGQFLLEVTSAYFLARVYFRTLDQIYALMRPLLLIITVAVILGIPEAISHQKPIIQYTSQLTGVSPGFYAPGMDVRMGLRRAQAFFENPILFGLFCASGIGLFYYTEPRLLPRILKLLVAATGTFIALSSAPLLAMTSQFVMIAIEMLTRGMRNRLPVLMLLAGTLFFALDTFTQSGPFGIIINYLTFNQASSYNRVLIWRFGLDNITAHPFFGLVPDLWERAAWMKVSIDNFWIYTGLLSGFVGWGLLTFAVVGILWRFNRVPLRDLSKRHIRFRRGWSIMMIAFVLTGFSVMFFGKLQPWFYFLLGLGAAATRIYLIDAQQRRRASIDAIGCPDDGSAYLVPAPEGRST